MRITCDRNGTALGVDYDDEAELNAAHGVVGGVVGQSVYVLFEPDSDSAAFFAKAWFDASTAPGTVTSGEVELAGLDGRFALELASHQGAERDAPVTVTLTNLARTVAPTPPDDWETPNGGGAAATAPDESVAAGSAGGATAAAAGVATAATATAVLDPEPADEPPATEDAPEALVEEETNREPVSLVGTPATGRPMPWELLCLAGIALFAVIIRLIDVTALPAGIHGDEGITGLEGLRVIDDGHIGVYTQSALGQPTLPFYITAMSIAILGDSILAIRLPSVIAGLASVLLLWWVVRSRLGVPEALIAAFVLAAMGWHLHYSRIAFGLAWWPLVAIGCVALLDRAMRTQQLRDWAAAGACAAIGVYVYNAHWIFGASIAIATAVWAVTKFSERGVGLVKELAAFAGGGVVVLAPMLLYILDSETDYGGHLGVIGLRATPEWIDGGFGDKFSLLIKAYLHAWSILFFEPDLDWVDASGILQPVNRLVLLAAVAGLVLWMRASLSGDRPPGRRFLGIVLTVLLVMPIAPALTQRGHGWLRREYVMAPMIAICAAIACAMLYRWMRTKGEVAALVGALLLAVAIAMPAVRDYFTTFRDNGTHQWVFVAELSEPAQVMNAYDDGAAFINFYSPRHSINYETLQYLSPDRVGVDRSNEFSADPGTHIVAPQGGPQLFVLVSNYIPLVQQLESEYPQGQLVAEGLSGGVPYAAYHVP